MDPSARRRRSSTTRGVGGILAFLDDTATAPPPRTILTATRASLDSYPPYDGTSSSDSSRRDSTVSELSTESRSGNDDSSTDEHDSVLDTDDDDDDDNASDHHGNVPLGRNRTVLDAAVGHVKDEEEERHLPTDDEAVAGSPTKLFSDTALEEDDEVGEEDDESYSDDDTEEEEYDDDESVDLTNADEQEFQQLARKGKGQSNAQPLPSIPAVTDAMTQKTRPAGITTTTTTILHNSTPSPNMGNADAQSPANSVSDDSSEADVEAEICNEDETVSFEEVQVALCSDEEERTTEPEAAKVKRQPPSPLAGVAANVSTPEIPHEILTDPANVLISPLANGVAATLTALSTNNQMTDHCSSIHGSSGKRDESSVVQNLSAALTKSIGRNTNNFGTIPPFDEKTTKSVGDTNQLLECNDAPSQASVASAYAQALLHSSSTAETKVDSSTSRSPPRYTGDEGNLLLSPHVPTMTDGKISADENLAPSNDFTTVSKATRKSKLRREGSIKQGKWTLGTKIGSGAFGVVHVGMNTQTGTFMAVKSIRMERAVMKDVRREIDLLKSIQHRNVVRYYGAEIDAKYLHIFQEWVSGGSVTGMLCKFGAFAPEVLRSYLCQILEGLSYLHSNDIMHRDIKGSNILVSNEGVVKLADFGASKKLAKLQGEAMMSLTMRGTPYFMAPEMFEERYNLNADIWSVGCVAVQMATGTPPFKDLGLSNPVALFRYIKKLDGALPCLKKLPVTDDTRLTYQLFERFLVRCFCPDPQKRPKAEECLLDPFFVLTEHSFDEDPAEASRGLFSPYSVGSSEFVHSPCRTTSPWRRSRPRRNSLGPSRSPFLSPPLPKRSHALAASPLPLSPPPDVSQWPTWAREKMEASSVRRRIRPVLTSPLMSRMINTFDSLAVSGNTRGSMDGMNGTGLHGVKLLDSLEYSQK